jgi:uncharacterized protein involved in propanediol utilization
MLYPPARSRKTLSNISIGSAFGHAGEFLQGAISDGGKLHRILISIPAPSLRSDAIFTATKENELAVTPHWKRKGLKAFQIAWLQFSHTRPAGTLAIESNIPVSCGMGSSTADCVAAIRAAAAYWNRELHADTIASLAHQAECFSDATMYEERLVVFQHCEGKSYEYLNGSIPDFQLLVVESGTDCSVDTDMLMRPDYSAAEISRFSECLTRFRQACATNDMQEIAHISTISAQINQRYHPKPRMNEVVNIANKHNAMGVAVAHSGSIQILLYAPGSLTAQVLRVVSNELEEIGIKNWQALSTLRESEKIVNLKR